ncbi:hypothetical protein FRC11_008220 [Ceratobasidium sp. 423]|nr:hypothetical protein FRC11_008220 [Ceratobasidium sp. 423]
MTRPFFVRERISEFDLFDNYTQKLLARITECVDAGLPVDVQDLYGRLTIDAAGEFLFSSTSLNTLSLPLPIAYKAQIGPRGTAAPTSYGSFVSAFDEAQTIIPVRGRMGPYIWPAVEWKEDKTWKHRCVVNQWVKPLIDSAIQRREEFLKDGGEKTRPAGDTFIDDLVSSTDDKALIMDELVNILLAARDTCLGQQFAYNEASFVLIRLLQKFTTFELAMDAAPAGSIPPPEWAGQSGRKGIEKVWVKNAITLYSKGGMWVRVGRA